VYVCSPLRKGWAMRLWWAGCYKWYQSRPSRLRVQVSVVMRLWWAGVTNDIRADPRGSAYGSACGHRVHGACGPEMEHMAWHMGRHWTYGCALRGEVPGHLPESVCRHMHVRVGLGWGT
jgi:hypothetical protein